MGRAVIGDVGPYHIAGVVDPPGRIAHGSVAAAAAVGVRRQRREDSLVVDKAVLEAAYVWSCTCLNAVLSYDEAVVVEAKGFGRDGAGWVDRGVVVLRKRWRGVSKSGG